MKRVYFSDVHMGKHLDNMGANEYVWLDIKDAFRSFLDYLATSDADEVVIVGDFLDNWVVPIDVKPPTFLDIINDESNRAIRNSLVNLSNNKNVIYLPGNHDQTVDRNSVKTCFPNIRYGSDDSGSLVYKVPDEKIVIEHGTSHAMFNGPDPAYKLPLGYFISRVEATRVARIGKEMSATASIAYFLAHEANSLVKKIPLAEDTFNAVIEDSAAAGIKPSDPVWLDPSYTDINSLLDPQGDGFITLGEIRDKYADICEQWSNPDLGSAEAAACDIDNLTYITDLYMNNGAGIVIMGHTHTEACITYPKDSGKIYANCGSWCKKAKTPIYTMNPTGTFLDIKTSQASGIFIETVTSKGVVTVTPKYWDASNRRPADNGSSLSCIIQD